MSEESAFIHELVTPLTIAQTHVRVLRTALAKAPDKPLASEDLAMRLEKAATALERMVQLVADRRQLLHDRQQG